MYRNDVFHDINFYSEELAFYEQQLSIIEQEEREEIPQREVSYLYSQWARLNRRPPNGVRGWLSVLL